MRLYPARIFLQILIAGIILVALIAAGDQGVQQPLTTLRQILGVVFILLVPGYSLLIALFPNQRDLDLLARGALSFGLSIAILPAVVLVLSVLGLGIRVWPIVIALGLFISICALVALFRYRRLPEEEKSGGVFTSDIKGWWTAQDRVFRWLYLAFGLSLLMGAGSAVAVSLEKPGEPFTEFYLLDSKGLSEGYPREAAVGEQVVFRFGITNHEGLRSEYKIVAVHEGEQALGAIGTIALEDGAVWEGSMTFAIPQAGDGQEVEFLLERIGSPWPYRTLRIWMNINPLEETPIDRPPVATGVSVLGSFWNWAIEGKLC